MKTNKLWSIFVMLVLVLGTTMTISSCSKEEEPESTIKKDDTPVNSQVDKEDDDKTPSIYGTWKQYGGSGDGMWYPNYLTFEKDGTFSMYSATETFFDGKLVKKEIHDSKKGIFVYDSTGHITLRYDGESSSISYLVTSISEKTMTWMDNDGDTEILDRQ